MDQLPATQYFDLELVNGVVMLKPVKVLDTNLDQIRYKIDKLGLKPDSVNEAIRWAKSK
jgi:hypothetical protein